MQDGYEKCLVCGERIPLHTRRCPHCGRELLDRHAWYNKYASNIVGAVLGAIFGPFIIVSVLALTHWRDRFSGHHHYEADLHLVAWLVAASVVGLVVGCFAWDRMRVVVEFLAPRGHWHRWGI